MPKPLAELLADLHSEPNQPGVLQNVIDDMLASDEVPQGTKLALPDIRESVQRPGPDSLRAAQEYLVGELESLTGEGAPLRRSLRVDVPPRRIDFEREGGRRKSLTKRFGSCVKAVRKTVKVRKGSNAESAAIAICTTSMLHPRGRTLKRYRKGRLVTQTRK